MQMMQMIDHPASKHVAVRAPALASLWLCRAVAQGEAADQDALTSAGLLNLLTAKQRSLAECLQSSWLLLWCAVSCRARLLTRMR
jgi:hypothetical protein